MHEASSKGLEPERAQLTLPSQNNSLRMHCRLEEEHRLEVKRLQTVPHLKDHKTGFIDLRGKPELAVLLPARLQERSHSEGEGLVARPVGGGHRQLQRANTLNHILWRGKMITWSFQKSIIKVHHFLCFRLKCRCQQCDIFSHLKPDIHLLVV